MELLREDNGVYRYIPRKDAIRYNGRYYVPTSKDTKWVGNWSEFKAAGGLAEFTEDQTEITLHLPAPYKFATGFNTDF